MIRLDRPRIKPAESVLRHGPSALQVANPV